MRVLVRSLDVDLQAGLLAFHVEDKLQQFGPAFKYLAISDTTKYSPYIKIKFVYAQQVLIEDNSFHLTHIFRDPLYFLKLILLAVLSSIHCE